MDRALFLSFNGRINRAKFWLLTALAILAILPAAYFFRNPPATETQTVVAVASLVVAVYLQFVSGIKRLHDRNRSGFVILAYGLGATALEWIGDRVPNDAVAIVFYGAATAVGAWYVVEVGFRRGTRGENDYGRDPLDGVA
jgi:uncharacterized membrane protein YhaH (DUF805 family)